MLELFEQLQDQGPENAAQLKELEHVLAEHRLEAADIVLHAHQRQAANQVSIGNVITSMRLISALDWTAFFERSSHVEQALRRDPAEVYAAMDPATRDRYRHVVERLAKGSGRGESAVAKQVLDLAAQAAAEGRPWRERHVGFFLVDRGRDRAGNIAALPSQISGLDSAGHYCAGPRPSFWEAWWAGPQSWC